MFPRVPHHHTWSMECHCGRRSPLLPATRAHGTPPQTPTERDAKIQSNNGKSGGSRHFVQCTEHMQKARAAGALCEAEGCLPGVQLAPPRSARRWRPGRAQRRAAAHLRRQGSGGGPGAPGCTSSAPLAQLSRLVLALDHHGRLLVQLIGLLTGQPLVGEEGGCRFTRGVAK